MYCAPNAPRRAERPHGFPDAKDAAKLNARYEKVTAQFEQKERRANDARDRLEVYDAVSEARAIAIPDTHSSRRDDVSPLRAADYDCHGGHSVSQDMDRARGPH